MSGIGAVATNLGNSHTNEKHDNILKKRVMYDISHTPVLTLIDYLDTMVTKAKFVCERHDEASRHCLVLPFHKS